MYPRHAVKEETSMLGTWLRSRRGHIDGPPRLDLIEAADPASTTSPEAHIDLCHVSKVYESAAGKFSALKAVSLSVQPGEFVGIVGKSGCGKSTLINTITGIDRPTSGDVIVAGTPVNRLSEGEIAEWRGRTVGVIFQFFQLLPMLSAVENVMLPMDFCGMYHPDERPERALRLLERVGVADSASKLPLALSGGQQQRVAI